MSTHPLAGGEALESRRLLRCRDDGGARLHGEAAPPRYDLCSIMSIETIDTHFNRSGLMADAPSVF